MLVESLIRLGLPYLKGNVLAREIIEQITDITNPMTRNFWQNIWIVECLKETNQISIHFHQWGDFHKEKEKGKEVFLPDYEKVAAAPISLPSGGNPIEAQGAYGVPAYPMYDKHFNNFLNNPNEFIEFLKSRLKRTEMEKLDDEILENIGKEISKAFKKQYPKKDNKKKLGVLILTIVDKDSPYYYEESGFSTDKYVVFSESGIKKDKFLALDLNKAVSKIWKAKEKEGEEKGSIEKGKCHFTGEEGKVISIYNKAWSWFTTTWEAPFSIYQDQKKLVESIALSPETYRALTFGASLIKRLTKPIPSWLVKEIFAPVNSGKAREFARTATEIYGFAFVLPITDSFLETEEDMQDFIYGMHSIIHENDKSTTSLHLKNIVGIPSFLPESLQKEVYRLSIVYYTGDSNKGDIHLRAFIEDVIPSTLQRVEKILEDLSIEEAAEVLGLKAVKSSYECLPYLLIKAYGGPYLWASMSKVLHREKIDKNLFVKNVSTRMSEFGKDLTQDFYKLKMEVLFYLIFTQFINEYNKYINCEGGLIMLDWKTLQQNIKNSRLEDFEVKSILEAGFYAGHIVRQFARQYYAANSKKEFIRDRVLTYGSSLTPEMIFKNALSKFEEYYFKLNIRLKEDLAAKSGIVNLYYIEHKEEIFKNKDDFLAAFWAGYSLNNK